MIIAMPMSRGRLAAHFTKAQRIGFFNEYHQLITSFDNPALAGGCSAKKAMLQLIQAQKTDIVIVQHIGERMLGKLLSAGISVSQGENSESIESLLSHTQQLDRRLVDASQGRVSLNHQKKGGCCGSACSSGGCGCGGHEEAKPSSLARPAAVESGEKSLSYAGFRPVS